MSLVSGTKLGPYEIISPLGAGGMGEVYRSNDTKLNRDVALKFLPEAFASDPERMARFQREAQVLASLNHPNIAAIYGLEESGGVRALVMELVEGPTLAEVVGARHGVPLPDTLHVARQIAEALEAAHEKGIVHRDLKPANVKITPEGTVKVLDFGLAKALDPIWDVGVLHESALQNSPTLSLSGQVGMAQPTRAGVILGTAAYISPEQAKGKQVDRRTDIWAFGCVLYEMLTGKRAFEGETLSDVLAAVIRADPDWTAIPEATPRTIQRLIRRCLTKDLKHRLQAIGDARITIEEALSGESDVGAQRAVPLPQPAAPLRHAPPWALAATTFGIVVLGVLAAYLLLRPKEQQPVIRFAVLPPENTSISTFAISPDGLKLAFVTVPTPTQRAEMWVRPLNSLSAHPLPGTDDAASPFWSPDSQTIGFYADLKLKKVAISGGPPQDLCDAVGEGGAWNREGAILFTNRGKLYSIPAAGGTPTLAAAPDSARGAVAFDLPQFLPDGRHFLFYASAAAGGGYVGAGQVGKKKTEKIFDANSNSLYVAPGYLLYVEENTLMARGFDATSLRFTGPAVPLGENAGEETAVRFSSSQTRTLAYQAGTGGGMDQMVWFSRKGGRIGVVGGPGFYVDPAISPDGTKLAVERVGQGVSAGDIWVYDLKRGTNSRLTFTGNNTDPVWSSDGRQILFSSSREDRMGIYQKPADGLGKTEPVVRSRQPMYLDSVADEGRYAAFMTPAPRTSQWVVPLSGDRKPFAFVQGSFESSRGYFSPNGRFISYDSDETGRFEVYVQTFPQHLGKWQVSTSGGTELTWRGDGREVFYLSPNNEIMSVAINTDSGTFQASLPKPLFKAQLDGGTYRNHYAVSPDGERFLVLAPAGESKPSPVIVVVNWPELLKSK